MKAYRSFWKPWIGLLAASLLFGCATENTADFSDNDSTETLYERYIERYDSSGPLVTWLYDETGALAEYSKFDYPDDLHETVSTYSSEAATEDVLVSKVYYTYDADGNLVSGEFWSVADGALTKQTVFSVTYNSQGNYLDYLEQDADGNAIEHRVCTYDSSGENYLSETYYSDAGTADRIVEYDCTYDSTDTWKYLQEDHYYLLDTGYERNVVHTFTWTADDLMYLQTDFDESDVMVQAIMYTFEDGKKKTRSFYNQNGLLLLYRTYQYNAAGTLIELCYYNYGNSEGNELTVKEAYSLYTDDAGNSMYEKRYYTYSYASKSPSLKGTESALSAGQLGKPAAAHHTDAD